MASCYSKLLDALSQPSEINLRRIVSFGSTPAIRRVPVEWPLRVVSGPSGGKRRRPGSAHDGRSSERQRCSKAVARGRPGKWLGRIEGDRSRTAAPSTPLRADGALDAIPQVRAAVAVARTMRASGAVHRVIRAALIKQHGVTLCLDAVARIRSGMQEAA